jgi:prepilin-type N-terminal cleavage/methylation domain-containing protein
MHMKSCTKGFTLTELIVVIALIGIMLAIVSLNFNTWQKKSIIENQAKEMMADLNGQRLQAMQTKTIRMAVFSIDPLISTHPLYVSYRSYTGAEQLNPTPTTGTEKFRKYPKYPVYTDATLTAPWQSNNPNYLLFDATGLLSNSQSFANIPVFIYIASTGTGAALDCLAISRTRMNLGQSNGTTCVYQ